ncbi:MAG TPA: tetratricopeptide repeat protein, partial [Tepidisphaeraceae bacterium]|nr:tetratricopeptide repeat protein [Tepidisphaeraceae bacterium]
MQVHWREHRRWFIAGGSAAVLIIVAIILIAHGVGRHSTKLLQTTASSLPADYLALLNQGKAQLDHLDFANAIASFQKATQIAPTDENTWRGLADAYLRAGQSELAIDAARKALALNHNSAAAHYLEGSAQLRQGQSEEAVKSLSACAAISPQTAAVHFQLGRAQQGMAHTDAAIAELRKAVEIEPEHPAAHYMLGQLLLRKGDSQSAQIELAHHEHIVSAAGNLSADPNRL